MKLNLDQVIQILVKYFAPLPLLALFIFLHEPFEVLPYYVIIASIQLTIIGFTWITDYKSGFYIFILSTFIIIYYYITPYESFRIDSWSNLVLIIFYIIQSFAVIAVAYKINQSIRTMRTSNSNLVESKRQLKDVIDGLFAFIMILNPDGSIKEINKALISVAIQGNTELIGKQLCETYPWNYSEVVQNRMRNAIETASSGKIVNYDEVIRVGLNKYRDVAIDIVPIMKNNAMDEVDYIIVSANDITERKHLEKKKDEFISIASHELKTPLTSLNGYVQLLGSRLRKHQDENMNFMTKMDKQIFKLTELINDLLDVSRIQTGNLSLERSTFDGIQLVEECIQEIQPLLNGHRIIFVKPDYDVFLYADRSRICQVLINLLTNAIKYSPGTNEINVYIKKLKDEYRFYVQDNGVGIAKDKLDKIFKKFYRVEDNVNADMSQGLGLGLYISHEIIRLHNGKIGVKSEEGKGSIFYFSVPFKTLE